LQRTEAQGALLFSQYRRILFFLKPKFFRYQNNFSSYTKFGNATPARVHPIVEWSKIHLLRTTNMFVPTFSLVIAIFSPT